MPPIKDCECEKCQIKFESITTSQTQEHECPKCGNTDVKLLPTGYMGLYSFKEPNTGVPSKRTYKKHHD
jgi:Zn finger protein HypA/HybF involved in hydrogenase expression